MSSNLIVSLSGAVKTNTMLLVFMAVLIVLVVLISALAIVFIVALRKRTPVVKVIMAPPVEGDSTQTDASAVESDAVTEQSSEEGSEQDNETESNVDDGEAVSFVTEGEERVRYDRSVSAKLMQIKDESKEWYSQIKNELLSYDKVKVRMSWKRESFRIGKSTFARIIVRGRTLCLLLALDPSGFAGTKYAVEDVGNIAFTEDTPCLYRLKSARRIKYAKELIAALMKELGVKKQPDYEPQDFYMPHKGDMALIQQGLVKRIVYGNTRTFEIRETNHEEAAASADPPVSNAE